MRFSRLDLAECFQNCQQRQFVLMQKLLLKIGKIEHGTII